MEHRTLTDVVICLGFVQSFDRPPPLFLQSSRLLKDRSLPRTTSDDSVVGSSPEINGQYRQVAFWAYGRLTQLIADCVWSTNLSYATHYSLTKTYNYCYMNSKSHSRIIAWFSIHIRIPVTLAKTFNSLE